MIRAVASKLEYDDNQFSFVQRESRNQEDNNRKQNSKTENIPKRETSKQLRERLKFSETYKIIKENRDINLQEVNLQEMMNNQYAIVLRSTSNQSLASGLDKPINLFGGVEDPLDKQLVGSAYVS